MKYLSTSGTDGSENGLDKSTHRSQKRRWLEVLPGKDKENGNQVVWIRVSVIAELKIPVNLGLVRLFE
jgi:hypothetical protein